MRGYADYIPLGASVIPLKATDSIMWTVKFRNGTLKRFKFPIRTTAEDQLTLIKGKAAILIIQN